MDTKETRIQKIFSIKGSGFGGRTSVVGQLEVFELLSNDGRRLKIGSLVSDTSNLIVEF
jgi:hypothetical protein